MHRIRLGSLVGRRKGMKAKINFPKNTILGGIVSCGLVRQVTLHHGGHEEETDITFPCLMDETLFGGGLGLEPPVILWIGGAGWWGGVVWLVGLGWWVWLDTTCFEYKCSVGFGFGMRIGIGMRMGIGGVGRLQQWRHGYHRHTLPHDRII